MLQAVTKKDSLMRGAMCGKLHGERSQLLFDLLQLFVSNRDFTYTCIGRSRYGDSRQNIAMAFGVEILVWLGYPTVKKN